MHLYNFQHIISRWPSGPMIGVDQ